MSSGAPDDVCDVAVVGGGPAGAAAAERAARAGARTVLCEAALLPRYKRCGGGLVGLSRELATGLLGPQVLQRLTRARPDVLAVSVRGGPERRLARRDLLSLVDRAPFDAALVAAAAAAGARVRTGVRVLDVDEDADGVSMRLRTPAGPQTLRARVVIGADGSASRIARHVGVRCDQVDLGLEGEFPADGWDGRLLLEFGTLGTYGWAFPKGDRLTVGVIGDRSQPDRLRAAYAALCDRLGVRGADPEGGHTTRVRAAESPLCTARVAVAGDAAGLLEPWTREGISFALRSGRLAGQAAADGDLARYPQRVHAALTPELEAGREFLAAYTRHPGAFGRGLTLPGGGALFARVIAGDTSLDLQARRPVMAAALRRLTR